MVEIEFNFTLSVGISSINFKNNNHSIEYFTTLGNYKNGYLKTEEQKTMNKIIKILRKNIEKIIKAIKNMQIIHLRTNEYKTIVNLSNLLPLPTINLELVQSEYRDKYFSLIKNVKEVEELFYSYLHIKRN